MKACLPLLAFAVAITGCSTTKVTNLTPENLPRQPDHTYPFEATWKTVRRGVDPNVEAYVLIEDRQFPMTPVEQTSGRWEARIPLSEDRMVVPYRYKFVYEYAGTLNKQRNSDLSPQYFLHLANP